MKFESKYAIGDKVKYKYSKINHEWLIRAVMFNSTNEPTYRIVSDSLMVLNDIVADEAEISLIEDEPENPSDTP